MNKGQMKTDGAANERESYRLFSGRLELMTGANTRRKVGHVCGLED